MRQFLVKDASVPLMHAALTVDVGSLADPEGKEGATRLLLRLMRRSVSGMTPEELEDETDRLGASLGLELNRSVCGLAGSVIARSQSQFLELFGKILTQPAFDESEFLQLKTETLADWEESLDNDSLLARRFFTRALFKEHPYGRLPSGTPDSLDRVEVDDLKRLHQQLFRQPRLLASFSGDVHERECDAWTSGLKNAFLESPGQEFPCPEPQGPIGRHLVFVDKPERTQTQILIGCLGTHPHDDDHVPLLLGNTIFGGTFTARLSHEVRAKRGWSYGATSHLPFDRKRHGFSMWTFPKAEDALACILLQLTLLEDLLERGVTQAELSSAKRYIKNSHPFTVDTAAKRASLLVDEAVYGLPPGYFENHVAQVQAVKREQVGQALRHRFSTKNLVIAVVGSKDPLFEQLKAGISDLDSSELVRFDSRR